MIERCGDRQRKLEGLKRWPLDTFVESLPVMFQIALLLLACGLCRHMVSINALIFGVLVALTAFGILFYIGIVIPGASSYECPFQTPASTNLRRLWKKVIPRITIMVSPIISVLRGPWEVLCQTLHNMLHLSLKLGAWRRFRRSRPATPLEVLPHTPRPTALSRLWKSILSKILHVAYCFPCTSKLNPRNHSRSSSLPTTRDSVFSQEMDPWLIPGDLAVFRRNNANDIRCVSWILRNITDPESLDAAVRLAGTIRWFEEGIDVEPPYDMILSIFESCLDSTKKVYPGMKERAYYSIRAILWIYALSKCKSSELAGKFSRPVIGWFGHPTDGLTHLLFTYCFRDLDPLRFVCTLFSNIYLPPPGTGQTHIQWVSNLLLHLAWTGQDDPSVFSNLYIGSGGLEFNDLDAIPLDATLNRFLIWCILLDSRVEEEVLRMQDKSYVISHFFFRVANAIFTSDRLESVSAQLSQAICTALAAPTPRHLQILKAILLSLRMWKSRPTLFTGMAYGWCSIICEQPMDTYRGRGREFLFLCLEIGFRHLDFRDGEVGGNRYTHPEHQQKMTDIVFESGDGEVIADLLHAWTPEYGRHIPLCACASYLVDLHRLRSPSLRLRHLLIRSIGLIGYPIFK